MTINDKYGVWMPLHIGRLQRSKTWLRCKREPALAFYVLNLWMRAWQENPAGSIEDDDDVLADAAMCSPDAWPDIKAKVLIGWEKRKDGRLWHGTVTELSEERSAHRQKQRQRTEKAREVLSQISDRPVTENMAVQSQNSEASVTDSTRQDKTRKEKKVPPLPPLRGGGVNDDEIPEPTVSRKGRGPAIKDDPEFERFWRGYRRKVDKGHARAVWPKAVQKASVDEIMAGLARFQWPDNPKYDPYPAKWLIGERWRDKPLDLLNGPDTERGSIDPRSGRRNTPMTGTF